MNSGATKNSRAFTLVELLVAMTVLSLLVVLISSVLSGVNKAWVAGEERVENYQTGRAILELITRELKSAVISPSLQFIQNPPMGTAEQNPWNQRKNSNALFWQSTLTSGPAGNICEVGYYLDKTFRLRRFYVPPDSASYNVYGAPPSALTAPWVTNFDPINQSGLFSTVADGILGLWVRCMDRNGDTIPWYQSTGVLYNSAATFQPAIPGQFSSFKYTNAATTAQAHLLPYSVEITVITLDAKTLQRSGTAAIPGMPPDTSDASSPNVPSPNDIPGAIRYFEQKLVLNKIKSARTFSTSVRLPKTSQ